MLDMLDSTRIVFENLAGDISEGEGFIVKSTDTENEVEGNNDDNDDDKGPAAVTLEGEDEPADLDTIRGDEMDDEEWKAPLFPELSTDEDEEEEDEKATVGDEEPVDVDMVEDAEGEEEEEEPAFLYESAAEGNDESFYLDMTSGDAEEEEAEEESVDLDTVEGNERRRLHFCTNPRPKVTRPKATIYLSTRKLTIPIMRSRMRRSPSLWTTR